MQPGDEIELTCERVVAGGDAIAREPDGRIVFVRGGLPGEAVIARADVVRKDRVNATAIAIVDASADRVDPPCDRVAQGCGGCEWQHITPRAQGELKHSIVVDALTRIGRLPDAVVHRTISLADRNYRTTLRAIVTSDGRLALRRRGSHEPVGVDGCMVAHPRVREVLDAATFGDAHEVLIRVGAGTDELLVMIDGDASAVTGIPEGATVVPKHDSGAHFNAKVRERRFRISGGSFFQSHVDSPDALVSLVQAAVAPLGHLHRVADMYAGVGLFGAFIEADSIIAIEASRAAARDAKSNLSGRGARGAIVVCAKVESADLGDCDVVIADPPRDGLGDGGVRVVNDADPAMVVLISCEPAAGARDLRSLTGLGFTLETVQPVDQFPHTSHVEMVSILRRG